MLPIESVQLILIHVKPFNSDCSITEVDLSPLKNNSKILLETHDVKATRHGIAIANRLLNLVRRHYDLSVTSITGIPMKVITFALLDCTWYNTDLNLWELKLKIYSKQGIATRLVGMLCCLLTFGINWALQLKPNFIFSRKLIRF